MKRKSGVKVIIIVLVITLVLGGGGLGGWYYLQNRNAEPVNVFPFEYVGMTEYWGDSQESYGPVTTDRIQTVFISDTQTITEILVSPGDEVQKGDLLMTYDTTLSDLALERERLEVEKLKLQLEKAKEELKDIKKMKPMVIPETSSKPEPQPDQGIALTGDYQISQNKVYDGSSSEKAMILWLRDTAGLDDEIFEAVRVKAEEYQKANLEVPEQTNPESTESGKLPPETADTTDPATEQTETSEAGTEPTSAPTVPPEEENPGDNPEEPTVPSVPPADVTVNKFYMAVKITQNNLSMGSRSVWQGLEVTKAGGQFTFRFFDAAGLKDHTVVEQSTTVPTAPQIDLGSGYTASQIAQMRSEKEKQIKDLQFQIKMAEADYAIKMTELDSGEVTSEIDGIVVSLISEEEAKQTMQPLMKISGGGGFYVEGSVSELEKSNLQIGQEVTINDWNTGMEYIGTVKSVGDFPAQDGNWNGMGNPNASYYPFTVFIDESADLQEGNYVNVVYSTATTEQGVYLENPFMRNEQGNTYVYVRGSDGKLEKRLVTTGKSLWGSYTQILSGLDPEDLVAFPYGKNVTEGADTVESDLSALYG